MRRSMHPLLVIVLILGSTGCTSSGGGGASSTSLSVPGLWAGSFTNFGQMQASSAIVFMHNSRLMMVDDNDVIYDGPYLPVGSNQFQAQTVKRKNANGPILPDVTINGTVRPDNRFGQLMDVTINTVNSSSIPDNLQLFPDPAYQLDSSLARIADFWLGSLGLEAITFNILETGVSNITANSDFCIFTGNVSTLNTQRNLYSINLTAFSDVGCSVGGTYSGFAALYDDDDVLRMMLASADRGLYFELDRQP